MKLCLVIILIFNSQVMAQDVKVPGNLFNENLINDTSYEDEEETTLEAVESPIEIISTTVLPVLVETTKVSAPPIIESKTFEPEMEQLIECPIGFIKTGSTCTPLYTNKCPSGFVWKNDKCILSRTICPLNFDFNGMSCVERPICPPNHVWRNEMCEAPEPECLPGWRWNGNMCTVENIQCQAGFVLKGRECVLEKITCPTGFELVNDECIEPKPVCPPDYELQESGFCVHVNMKCPPGTVMINGKCQKTVKRCPPGYEIIGDQCFRTLQIHSTTTHTPTIVAPDRELMNESNIFEELPVTNKVCPGDYTFYRGQCYKCPAGYNLCNGMCSKKIATCNFFNPPQTYNNPPYPVPNVHVHLNIPQQNVPQHVPHYDRKPVQIVNNIEPFNNTIHNINNVSHPVTLNNVNENNVYIYTDTQCADGKIRTTIIKNNQTISGCEDGASLNVEAPVKDSEIRETKVEQKEEKCCEIVTPRRCKKRFTSQWMCSHRRYKHCGNVCTASRIYVKPRANVWINQVLTFAPNPDQTYIKPCLENDCPPVDCTGCTDGSYNCSPQCYTYPCTGSSCTYINQHEFCESVSDREFCD